MLSTAHIVQLMDKGEYKKAITYIDSLNLGDNAEELTVIKIYDSIISGLLGDNDRSLARAEEALQLSIQLDTATLIIGSYFAMAEILLKTRDYDRCAEVLKSGEEIAKLNPNPSRDDQYWYAKLNRVKGIYNFHMGNLTNSIRTFQESYNLALDIGDPALEAQLLGNIAVVNYYLGEIELSLESHLEAIKKTEALEQAGNYNLGGLVNNVGLLYYSKGEPVNALKYFNKSREIFEEIGNSQFTVLNYHNIVRTFILLEDRVQARQFLDKIADIATEEDAYSNLIHRVTKAIYLKSSGRIRDKAKAQELFEEIIHGEQIDYQFTQLALYNLTEMLIDELENYGDETIINDIVGIIEKLSTIAEEQRSQSVMAEVYLLRSRLALFDGRVDEAKSFLNQGISIAEKQGLRTLASVISKSLDDIVQHESFWNRLSQGSQPVLERLNVVDFKETIRQLANNQLISENFEEEEPVIFLIITDTGLPIYFKKFGKPGEGIGLNEMLISNFITAIDLFGRETFHTKHYVERIQFKDQMIIMKIYEQVVFIYSFKGQSYSAAKKMDNLIDIILNIKQLKDEILGFEMSIPVSTQRQLDEIVDEVFLHDKPITGGNSQFLDYP